MMLLLSISLEDELWFYSKKFDLVDWLNVNIR